MRRAASNGRNLGLPASERLKWKLSSTAGMHLVAAMHEDDASSWSQVLHSTAWAARNFRHTVEALGKHSKTSSDSRFLQLQAAGQGSEGGSEIVAEMQDRLTGSTTGDQSFSAEATDTSSGEQTGSLISTDAEAHLNEEPNRYVLGVHNTGTRIIPSDDRQSAAVRIQAAFIAKREAATKIQAVFRMWLARKRHAELRRAAMQIQHWYRIRRSRRLEKQILLEATLATAIQAHARGFLVRRMVQRWNAAAFTIQQSWRRKLQSTHRSFAAESAATKIQACYRSSVARKQYLLARKSAIRIQEAYRRWASELKNSSAACIQAHVRGFRTRRMLRRWNGAACLIQQCWINFRRHAAAAKRIQRQWRLFKVVSVSSTSCSEPSVPSDSHREDWNTVEVDHLEHCLDTCLATLHPQLRAEQCALNLPLSPGCSPVKSIRIEELAAYKRDLKEGRLQQAARVFLLQHHIAIQQQRAQHAPPFPPWQQQKESGGNNSYSISNNNNDRKIIQTQIDYRKPNTEALPQAQGDVILDVQYLLEQVHKLSSNGGSSSSVVYMQNESIIDIDFTGEKLKTTRQHQQLVGFKQMNALLVVFVAVIIYTKSICQGVFVWAKRPAKK